MWKEFKEFAFKGNVVDLAVAVVHEVRRSAVAVEEGQHVGFLEIGRAHV